MASSAAKECKICNEAFNEKERCPRCLPCIHSLCSHCIQNLITINSKICPFCRQPFKANSATDLKVNTGLLDLLRLFWEMELKDQSPSDARSNWKEEFLQESEELIKKNISDCRKAKEDIDSLVETNSAIQNSLSKANDTILNEIMVQMSERVAKNKTRMEKLEEKKNLLMNQKREIDVKKMKMEEAQEKLTVSKRSSKPVSILVDIESVNTDVKTWLQSLENYLAANKTMHQKLEKGTKKTTEKISVVHEVLNSQKEEEMDDYVAVLPEPPALTVIESMPYKEMLSLSSDEDIPRFPGKKQSSRRWSAHKSTKMAQQPERRPADTDTERDDRLDWNGVRSFVRHQNIQIKSDTRNLQDLQSRQKSTYTQARD